MKGLVIAPTATYRKGLSVESVTQLNDTIKDSPDAVNTKQKLNKIIPAGTNKGSKATAQKTYFDLRQVHHELVRNRARALEVFELDNLYETRPMYNISLPEMKLRHKDLGGVPG